MKSNPHTSFAIIVHAEAMRVSAWCIRGGAYASDVPSQPMQQFSQYEQDAAALLDAGKNDADSDPEWYADRERIASEMGDGATLMKISKEGITKYPLYYRTYENMMIALAPRWGGSNASTESFAKWAMTNTQDQIGSELYARLYWNVSNALGLKDLRKETTIDWDVMVKSMESLAKKYPDPWNLESLAGLSCRSGDVPEAVKLLRMEVPAVDVASWESIAKDGICERVLD